MMQAGVTIAVITVIIARLKGNCDGDIDGVMMHGNGACMHVLDSPATLAIQVLHGEYQRTSCVGHHRAY